LISKAFSLEFNQAFEYVNDRPGHDFRYSLNSTKIRNSASFNPERDMESELNRLINEAPL
jgi:dTDP-glucose 4,6-dehydratase